MNTPIDLLCQYTIANCDLKLSRSGNIITASDPYLFRKTPFIQALDTLGAGISENVYKWFEADTAKVFSGDYDSEIKAALTRAILEKEKQDKANRLQGLEANLDGGSVSVWDIQLIKIADKYRKASFLYIPKTDETLPHDWDAIQALFAETFPEPEMKAEYLARQSKFMIQTYKPFKYEDGKEFYREIETPGSQPNEFNLWTRPEWVKGWRRGSAANLDPQTNDFLEYLVPCEDQRRTLLHWIYKAIFERASAALCLLGQTGIGKTLIITELLGNMLGPTNWTKAEAGSHSSRFKSGKELLQLLFFEELGIPNASARNDINTYLDGKINPEGKGVDVKNKLLDFPASIVTSNNNIANFYAIPGERRYFYPDLQTGPKLDDYFGDGDPHKGFQVIEGLIDWWRSVEFQQHFANYLLIHFQEAGSLKIPHTKTLNDVVRENMPQWSVQAFDRLASGESLTDRDILSLNTGQKRGSAIRLNKVIDRLTDLEAMEGKKIYRVEEGSTNTQYRLISLSSSADEVTL